MRKINKLSNDEIKHFLKMGKDPLEIFIERNKFLASKNLIGDSKIEWVVPLEVAYELIHKNETKNS